MQSGDSVAILKKGKIIEGYLIVYVGNFESAQEALNIISHKNCQDNCYSPNESFNSNTNNKEELQNLRTENELLKKENQILKEKILNLTKINEKYKNDSMYYDQILTLVDQQRSNKEPNPRIIIESSEDIIIDSLSPSISIKRFQFNQLENLPNNKGQLAVRMLVDFLFSKEDIIGQNYTTLMADRAKSKIINVIFKYVKTKFVISDAQIVKTITNKCIRK